VSPLVALTAVALAGVLGIAGYAGYAGYEWLEAPPNQFFGRTVVGGASTLREVSLTYDDGPNPPYTDRILDVLRAEHVHATFFLVGRAVAAHPALARRIVADGNAVGDHSWSHAHLYLGSPPAIRSDLERTSDAIAAATGVRPRYMRPPFGARDFAVVDAAHALGLDIVMWSAPLARDWEQPGTGTIVRRVLAGVRDGSIIVLHDGDRGIACGPGDPRCDRSQEIAATREIIDALRARGYRFVTIDRLVAQSGRGAVTRSDDR